MSDIEEPPTKVAKYEMSQTFTQSGEMDETHEEAEGQEEWLSDGLLTDDDTAPEQNQTTQLQDTSIESQDGPTTQEANAKIDANIEKTLNSMDNSQSSQPNDAFDELLKQEQNMKKDESDENDTDDLLRMLEDDDKSKKVKVMTKTKPKEPPKDDNASTDDDEDGYIYQGTTVTKLKVAKNAVIQRYPTKAMPETTDDDETDASSEDVKAMQKMFAAKKPTKPSQTDAKPAPKLQPLKKQFEPKKVVRVGNNNSFRQVSDKRPAPTPQPRLVTSTPIPRPAATKSLLKSALSKPAPAAKPAAPARPVKTVAKPAEKVVKPEIKKMQVEHNEIINEEEFLEEDGFDLDEHFAAESDSELERRRVRQRIMKPEQMDEDMLSDRDTDSEADSLYDELPSSDSDDMDDWFTLDLRAERASDYIPLLGPKAYELLSQEKSRVSTRLSSLKQSLSSLNADSRQRAERLRTASRALAEVDDLLKAH